jgi:hypothetical protein
VTVKATLADRQARRDQLRKQLLQRAEAEARTIGRSLKCAEDPERLFSWRHAGDPDGCKSDGTNCLCECHDPVPAPSGSAR